MPIDTLTDKNLQFPLRIVYLKHDFIQLYLYVRQISKNDYMYIEKKHIIFFKFYSTFIFHPENVNIL